MTPLVSCFSFLRADRFYCPFRGKLGQAVTVLAHDLVTFPSDSTVFAQAMVICPASLAALQFSLIMHPKYFASVAF